MTDNEIITFDDAISHCYETYLERDDLCKACREEHLQLAKWLEELKESRNTINRQKAEIERLQMDNKQLQSDVINANQNWDHIKGLWECEKEKVESAKQKVICACKMLKTAKSEAIKELSEKITEIFTRYAHLHTYAEGARKDFVVAVDGTEIEMQSVWDVHTLIRYEMGSEPEEMNRLQDNIETIAKERLLAELEKDFRLLVKEITEKNNDFKEV